MAAGELVRELIDAGIHFGHRSSHWNPKMKPYIYGKRNLIHIINIKETLRGILLARKFLAQLVSEGKDVVFVGTKRQARKSVQDVAEATDMHYVADRWLGGTLTNFREIRKRIGRLDELEAMEAEGALDMYSKKQGSSLRREMRKMRRNLGGIRKMTRMPGAMVIVDQRREIIAINEAKKLGIPVVCLLDTDSDPDLVDIPIPGNDDAMRGIAIILNSLGQAISEGKTMQAKQAEQPEETQARRRSRRPTTARAAKEQAEPTEGEESAPEAPAGAEAPSPPAEPQPAPEPKPAPPDESAESPTPPPAEEAAPAPEPAQDEQAQQQQS